MCIQSKNLTLNHAILSEVTRFKKNVFCHDDDVTRKLARNPKKRGKRKRNLTGVCSTLFSHSNELVSEK